jgi:hypothetical protein
LSLLPSPVLHFDDGECQYSTSHSKEWANPGGNALLGDASCPHYPHPTPEHGVLQSQLSPHSCLRDNDCFRGQEGRVGNVVRVGVGTERNRWVFILFPRARDNRDAHESCCLFRSSAAKSNTIRLVSVDTVSSFTDFPPRFPHGHPGVEPPTYDADWNVSFSRQSPRFALAFRRCGLLD